ncbi:MAG: hypothetical protein DMG61_22955 [Acidobacteria bacterium]|nr:MAG: hypothetical protein DMG61_22955 [Acidobacteriota bacterium]
MGLKDFAYKVSQRMHNRVHVVIPKELTDEVDSVVSERGRSAFICDAVREKLIREKQVNALEKLKTHAFKGGPKEWAVIRQDGFVVCGRRASRFVLSDSGKGINKCIS